MKSLLLLICIISTLGLQVPAANIKRQTMMMTTSVCAGKDSVLVAMPGSCSGFYFCIKGNAVASSCGNFYHFNARLAICDHPARASCNNQTTIAPEVIEVDSDVEATDICRQSPEGHILGKNGSCTLFYVCRQQNAIRRVCPPLKLFNLQTKQCLDSDQVNCAWKHIDNDNAESTPIMETLPQIHSTSTNLIKPEIATSKKPLAPVHYSKISFSVESICSAHKANVTIAHPWDCGKFIYCMPDHPQLMACPQGLHFNSKTARCEWTTVANCNLMV